jgi:hypothetical protein
MKKNYLLETKTCIFLNSYDEREIFLDIFLHQLQKYITNIPIFIIKGSKIYKSRETNLNINVINTNYKSPIDKNFLYDLNWGYRYIDGIKFLKENNYKYVIRFDDDGFIQNIDSALFNDDIIHVLENTKADRLQLYGPDPHNVLLPIDSNYSEISPEGHYGHYITNQCSLWNIDSCFKITHQGLNACSIEGEGSNIARKIGMKCITFNTPIITGHGLNSWDKGYTDGNNIVKNYCDFYNLDYNQVLLKIKNWKDDITY